MRRTDDRLHLDRRARILDAAASCFARAGFHRSTMQDVAGEAGMSAANLYRYFPSKDAIVAGLAERDRADLAADMAGLGEADDVLAAFGRVAAKHLVDAPREKAALCVEIWAEATRNPEVAALSAGFEREVRDHLVGVLAAARGRGLVAAGVDIGMVARLVVTLADGLFKRRALESGFDGRAELAMLLAVVGAALRGSVPARRRGRAPGSGTRGSGT